MGILKRWVAQYKYIKGIKEMGKQLKECKNIYNCNENRIRELERLMEEDRKLRNESCKHMTNKEKIQSMSTEELAFLLSYFSTCDHCVYIETECARKPNYEIHCEDGIAAWLEQEVKV